MAAGVNEFIVDGVSGLSPSNAASCMVAGICSDGEIGKAYILGPDSDMSALGVGPLVDRLKDIFATGGQSASVVAVPVSGTPGGHITAVKHVGTGPEATVTGVPVQNVDFVLEVVSAGDPGTATYRTSVFTGGVPIIDGGVNWGAADTVPANGQITIGSTGLTLNLADGLIAGDTYSFSARMPIGIVLHTGTGPDITPTGDVGASADVILRIMSGGLPNVGTYMMSIDGGDNWDIERTIPLSGIIPVGSTGISIEVSGTVAMVSGDEYTFELYAPAPTINGVMQAIEQPLDVYDVDFVYVTGESNAVAWAAMGAKADDLFNEHRPTYFICESRRPQAGEDIDEWVTAMLSERSGVAHRFVSVCAAYGEVSDTSGIRLERNFCGLLAGRILSIPVQTAIGKVALGSISQASLPDDFSSAHQEQLEAGGFVTAKRYAGMNGVYWGDARTLADDTSDYRYIEVLRTVFKAIRIARVAALKSSYNEAGDPAAEGGASGINALKADIEVALEQMTKAIPSELAAVVVTIPDGQDVVNNGISVILDIIGIPIIRQIRLYARYVYAGSSFDPRLEG